MRILHLTPGTGSFHCGSCLRDNALIKALRVRGHDAVMVPLYLPLVTDREAASPTVPVQVGGISLYLQEKFTWFHRMPGFVHRWLNAPDRLRKASARMGMTSPQELGKLTIGTLLGREGRQWGEWHKLVKWIRTQPKPDVVSLSNCLLTGLAEAIEEEIGVPVVCSLQGEDSFIETLPEPYREQAWEAIQKNAEHVKRFIAPSRFYAETMAGFMKLPTDDIAVVRNGLDFSNIAVSRPEPNYPVIGYLARMIHGKGLTTLVDAFIELWKRRSVPRVRLRIGGAKTQVDDAYVGELEKKLSEAGCRKQVEFLPNLTFDEKARFFRDLTVFSVPATYGEAFGLYVLEAMAGRVPVVQPRHGAFPELIDLTGGGVLCEPDDVMSLVNGLEDLLVDGPKREQLANAARTGVQAQFTPSKMAEAFDAVLEEAVKA
jgi:glycosyltransferase involved in cell wall biosynthesis